MFNITRWRPGLLVGILASVGMLTAVACGAAEEATPTPTTRPAATSTPTTAVPPTATPTLAPGETPTIATPTPTTAAAPTATPTSGAQPQYGGLLRHGSTEDPPSFDSHTATSNRHNIHNSKMNVNLVYTSNGGKAIEPHAAESYEISADGSVWTFKLRDNVRFQTGYEPVGPRDGTLMTAADVKYSLAKIMGLIDGIVSARSGWMKEFIDIARPDNGLVVVDDRTIEVHLVQPAPVLANILSIGYSSIFPEGTTREMLQSRPYGAGPWVLKDMQRGSLWKYERNPDYFMSGRPYLDEYNHVNIRGTEVIQSAFLTGQIDLMDGNPSPDNLSLFERLEADGKIRRLPYTLAIGGVSTCRPQGVNMNSYKPPFDDLELRQAVNLAIDREAYKQVVHYGFAIPHLWLDTGGWGRSLEEIMEMPGYRQPHGPDLAEAKAIMDRLYPNGLDVEMLTRDSSGYMRQAEFIAGELRKININVTINIQNSAVVFPAAQSGNYEIWAYWFCQTTATPEELIGSYFITSGSRNWLGPYSNSEVDAGYLDMAGTVDPVERRVKALALEDIVMRDLPSAPLPVHTSTWDLWNYIKNWPVTVSQYNNQKIENVWRDDS